MKWFSIFAAGIPVLCVLSARAELVSGISVVVNDSVITYAEIEDEVEKGAATAARRYANRLSDHLFVMARTANDLSLIHI